MQLEDVMPLYMLIKAITFAAVVLFSTSAGATIVAVWNNAALVEVRESRPWVASGMPPVAGKLGPPMVARALAIAHTCMYDAWAAYDKDAVGTTDLLGTRRRPPDERNDASKAEAISFAAYRCLINLFADSSRFATGTDATSRLAGMMGRLGYNPANDSTTQAGIGIAAGQAVIDDWSNDGSNQYGNLQNTPAQCPDSNVFCPYSDYTGYTPLNNPMPYCTPSMPDYLCPLLPLDIDAPNHWQPLIGPSELGSVTQKCIGAHWERVRPFALTSADQFDRMVLVPPLDIFGNAKEYEKNVDEILRLSAALDAERKLIVEYWADGPGSELPPGHWGLFAQFVSQRDQHSIDEDVKMFFAMHNASFDAGIVAWHLKHKYDGVRPITAVRYLRQGQKVFAWGGPGRPTEYIDGEKWIPYNPGSNLTPAFPGYVSGHSTFSSASAAVLRLFTGSDRFEFSTVIPANFGRVESGIPADETTISFATFSDAAQQAGLSRLYGGIHFSEDNKAGQAVGILIGLQAWAKAQQYFNGTAP